MEWSADGTSTGRWSKPLNPRRQPEHYVESVIPQPRCPHCRHFVYLDALQCPNCAGELGYHLLTRQFYGVRRGKTVIDGQTWYTCSNRGWDCNWLVWEDAPAGRCFSCRLTRRRPDPGDTVALDKLAKTEEAKRRLIVQLGDLGLPVVPECWQSSFISEYATMHPWEDFAETFAHYLHITGTLQTAAAIGIHLDAATNVRDTDVDPLGSYRDESVQRLLSDWDWMSQAFNRINRAMGFGDLYPFQLSAPVRTKLGFMHDIVTHAPLTLDEQIAQALPE